MHGSVIPYTEVLADAPVEAGAGCTDGCIVLSSGDVYRQYDDCWEQKQKSAGYSSSTTVQYRFTLF